MTNKMLEALKLAQDAERRRQGAAIDIHARTAWALARIGLLEVAGASDGKHYQNGNYVSCFLTYAGIHYGAEMAEGNWDDWPAASFDDPRCACRSLENHMLCPIRGFDDVTGYGKYLAKHAEAA